MYDNDFTFDEIISDIIHIDDIQVTPTDMGIGVKAFVGGLVNDTNDNIVTRQFFEFYASNKIPKNPKDKSLGFTQDDLIYEQGVAVVKVGETIDPPSYFGKIITKKEFKKQFINDKALKSDIDELFENLKKQASLSEEWLDKISTSYNNRVAGQNWLISEMSMC